MKIKFILAAAAVMLMAACGGKSGETEEKLQTDSLKFEQKGKDISVTIKCDFPQQAPETLKRAIAEYISETLGGTYAGGLENGDSILNFYGKCLYDSLVRDRKEYADEGIQDIPESYIKDTFKKDAETEKYVTYTFLSDIYQGGAHGLSSTSGMTFRKSDGRRFGYEMLRNTYNIEFAEMLKEGIKKYFRDNGEHVVSDEQLAEYLIGCDVYNIPLPRTQPYVTAKGVVFVYQSYEITSYAMGTPIVTIPLEKMKPYMTVTALDMLQ